MKASRLWYSILPVPFFVFSSCGEKEVPAAPAAPAATPEAPADPAAAVPAEPELPPAAALSATERAEILGFVGHLDPEADVVMSIYDGRGLVEGTRSLKSWKYLESMVEDEFGMDVEEEAAEPAAQADAFLGDEFFLALGDGAAEQLDIWNKFNSRMTYYQGRMFMQAFAKGAASGDLDSVGDMDENSWMLAMAEDAAKYMPWVEDAKVPGILAGLRVVDEEARGMGEEQLRSMMMFGEEVETTEFEKGGVTFSGLVFSGEMMTEDMKDDREEMDEVMGADNTDQLIEAVGKKTVMLAVGVLDEYVLLYIGGDEDGCPVVESVDESLAASDAVSFIDEFKDQPVHGFIYGSEPVAKLSVSSGLKDLAEGLRDGMKGVEGFGDTRELAAMLDLVGEKEAAMLEVFESKAVGGVIRLNEGLIFELFGGNEGALDYSAPHRLGGLGEGDNVLLFGNWVADEEYGDRASDLVELLVETTYAGAQHLAAMDIESEELEQFKGFFGMFDSMLKQDAIKLWDGMSTMAQGLGQESAIIVDLNASFPPIPGVPQGVVENGRFIRASYLSPVEDRTKLKDSWVAIDASVRSMLKNLSEAGMGEMSMLDPTSSEKNDLVTWYFDALAFSDDLKPSVTINDDWFVASTSKTQALDLIDAASNPAATVRHGSWMKLDLDVLRAYMAESLKLVGEEGEAIIDDEDDLAEFREMLPKVLDGMEAMSEVGSVTIHDRMERGVRRATLHFHAR